jgi:hypothetical protein
MESPARWLLNAEDRWVFMAKYMCNESNSGIIELIDMAGRMVCVNDHEQITDIQRLRRRTRTNECVMSEDMMCCAFGAFGWKRLG